MLGAGLLFADAMDQLFFGRASSAQTPDGVLGGVSLVIWTITLIVAIKYAILVLRAQNDGEGGFFALYGLLAEPKWKNLMWSDCWRKWPCISRSIYLPIDISGLCMSRKKTFCPDGGWAF